MPTYEELQFIYSMNMCKKKKKVSLKSENMPKIRKGKLVENVLQAASTQTEDECMPPDVFTLWQK